MAIDWLTRRASFLAGLGIILLALTTTYEVVVRYVFNSPTTWSFEIGTYLLLFCYMAMADAMREDLFPRADFVRPLLRPKARFIVEIATSLLSFPALGIFIWQGWAQTMDAAQSHERASSLLGTPLVLVKWVVPVAGALLLLEWMVVLRKRFQELREGEKTKATSELGIG